MRVCVRHTGVELFSDVQFLLLLHIYLDLTSGMYMYI